MIMIYALRQGQFGKIVYIGLTENIERRIREHNKRGVIQFSYITILDNTALFWKALEKEKYWINWATKHDQPLKNTIKPNTYFRDVCPECGQICGFTWQGGCKSAL